MKMQAVITGKRVHGVGYRVFLLQSSLELGFRKFNARNRVQNGTEEVVVQYEGEPGQVDAFTSIIRKEHPLDADVSDIAFEPYEGYILPVIDYMHIIKIELLTKGIPAILSIDEKQSRMLEKQDSMLEKMDQVETSITGEIRDMRTDLCSHLGKRLSAMEQDIQQIKAKIGLL